MSTPPPSVSERGWISRLRARLGAHWPLKMVGTTTVMTGFFCAYFWVLNHPQYPVTMMPLTALDRAIPFQPAALALYVSLWIYVPLAPALLGDRRELWSYAVATVALAAIGLAIFLRWPTTVPRPEIDWSRHPAFGILKGVDASGNACPSLHVAFAIFTGVWFERILRRMGAGLGVRAFNAAWCVGIVYSTLATRQHVALDVYAGAALGGAIAALHVWVMRERKVGEAQAGTASR